MDGEPAGVDVPNGERRAEKEQREGGEWAGSDKRWRGRIKESSMREKEIKSLNKKRAEKRNSAL